MMGDVRQLECWCGVVCVQLNATDRSVQQHQTGTGTETEQTLSGRQINISFGGALLWLLDDKMGLVNKHTRIEWHSNLRETEEGSSK